ncbi:DUF3152 domain-containing protein [Streptomyces sp. ST2-7A]|uniref:DUF3152 domain-containing protein n=1 Tax=Streptomyces sp. ST2-7A TaxID=2907214 RepID=UPI001F35CCA5|nr:DUF3152 domain-containing protein [Streptomyces sp. ST2-7A]MCE7082489.1 DUF3152 domain-containing protein [Streptomyces sp. ST2-7A]
MPPPYGHRDRSGPRPDYLAAFDEPDPDTGSDTGPRGSGAPPPATSEARGEESTGSDAGPDTAGSPTGRGRGHRAARRPRRGAERPAGRHPGDDGDPDDPGTPDSTGRVTGRTADAPEGRGRTITGAAAAAVVTVLAVTVAGQMTGTGPGPGERAATLAEGAPPPVPGGGPVDPGAAGDREESYADGADEPAGPPDFDTWFADPLEMDPETTGSGELVPVAGSDPAVNPEARTLLRYRVDVERELPDLGMDPEHFAQAVHRTLSDPRGWGNEGERSFARVSSGEYDFVITLATPGTTHDWCRRSALDTAIDNVSCDSASTERVVLNAFRWAEGAETFGSDMRGYREMLINHEVGHRIGYNHVVCPAEGELAPVMMQQTKFLTTAGITCEPNPWPHPDR